MSRDDYLYCWNYPDGIQLMTVWDCYELGVEHARLHFGPRISLRWEPVQRDAYWDGFESEQRCLDGK